MNAWRLWGQLSAGLLIAAVTAMPATADELIFYPTDDTQVVQYYGGDNFGYWQHMCVRNRYGSSPIWEVDSLIRFDISSIPPGTPIPSATLNLYYFNYWDNSPAGHPLTCYRITSDWDEDTVTWNTRPSWLPPGEWTDEATVPGSPGRWMEWDVTEDVQAFVDGTATDYGWAIMDETYWGGPNIPLIGFRTKEYDDRALWPYLEVVPEPGTLGLLLLGSLVVLNRRR